MEAAFGVRSITIAIPSAIEQHCQSVHTSSVQRSHGGEWFPTKEGTPDYAKTQMILVGIVIGLLSLTLACMPTRNLNTYWDRENTNVEIPVHETKAVDDMAIESAPRQEHNVPSNEKKADEIEKVEDANHTEKV